MVFQSYPFDISDLKYNFKRIYTVTIDDIEHLWFEAVVLIQKSPGMIKNKNS